MNLSGPAAGFEDTFGKNRLELIYSNGANMLLKRNLGERLLEQVPRSPTARQRK